MTVDYGGVCVCVYIFASGCELDIGYAAETMTLSASGASTVVVDLLITNKSTDSVAHLDIIYPRAMPGPDCFEDVTSTLTHRGHSYNSFYEGPGARLHLGGEVADVVDRYADAVMPTRGIPVAVEQTDPQAPNMTRLLYTGNVCGEHSVQPFPLSSVAEIIVDNLKFSLHRCVLTHPMEPNEARWLRWRIGPLTTCLNPMSRLTRGLRMLADKLTFHWQILGPGTVRDRFAESIDLFVEEALTSGQLAARTRLAPAAAGVRDAVRTQGYAAPGTETRVNDWRINVFPARCGRLGSVSYRGSVGVCGGLPNFVAITDYRHPEELCYQFKAGAHNTANMAGPGAPGDPDGQFIVDLEAPMSSFITPWVPWVALALSVWKIWGSDIAQWVSALADSVFGNR